MHWASAVSERVDTYTAIKEAARALRGGQPEPPDLVFAFLSSHHADHYERVSDWVREELGEATLVGCSAAGVIGGGQELEGREGVALIAGWLPGVQVRVGHVAEFLPATYEEWVEYLEINPTEKCHFLLFADSVTCDIDVVLQSLDNAFPGTIKAGGMANAGAEDAPATLFAHGDVLEGGAVVIALQGALELHAVVSQGCRPVGEPYIVTRSRGNVIKELNAGRPAEVLRRIYESLNPRDLALFNTSMFLGMDLGSQDTRSRYGRGDFLIRNILGIDPESGALAVDSRVDAYQVVQFHMRDRDTAAADLNERLRELARSELGPHIRGALMFSCFGRGERLFGSPNHDTDLFARRVGPVALSGFFCNGEVGPVGGRSCMHGYTSVFAVFCEPKTDPEPPI
jgi:small ligand-binding sensory domain FIST